MHSVIPSRMHNKAVLRVYKSCETKHEKVSVVSDSGILTFLIPHLDGTVSPSSPPGDTLWTLPGRQGKVEEMVERLGGRHPAGGPFGGLGRGDQP